MSLRLTLFGRAFLLASSLVLANALCWILSGIFFGRNRDTQPILSLALLAWTLGLRHALDADHISFPVTCGLFFSLGHSTVVIVVNVAIAISSSIYNRLDGVGAVGGIVGAAVSGSFLFIVGLANSIILWRIIRQRQKVSKTSQGARHNHMLMMRLLGPIITFVNKPWKVYTIVLFLLSILNVPRSQVSTPHPSIALLAVSALAHKKSDGSAIPSGEIVILPLLFTAGMTLIDTADSILMLYSYSGFPERGWAIIDRPRESSRSCREAGPSRTRLRLLSNPPVAELSTSQQERAASGKSVHAVNAQPITQIDRDLQVKANVMSGLSILLTLISIVVAFSISLITIMGLIGDQCTKCQAAANAPDGGGLAGRWWRGWANANDNSGYIGAAIVGSFVLVVACWYGSRRLLSARQARKRSSND
ncbi:NicO-domain-containing protein [Mycena olivaceomarginata]|nr:NicO-domain-containing protein [Mycena olivaceomarginata]